MTVALLGRQKKSEGAKGNKLSESTDKIFANVPADNVVV